MRPNKLSQGSLRAMRVVLALPHKIFGGGYEWIDLDIEPKPWERNGAGVTSRLIEFNGRIQKPGSAHEPHKVTVGYVSIKQANDLRPYGREDVNVMQLISPTKVCQVRLFCVDQRGRMRFRRIDLTRA